MYGHGRKNVIRHIICQQDVQMKCTEENYQESFLLLRCYVIQRKIMILPKTKIKILGIYPNNTEAVSFNASLNIT